MYFKKKKVFSFAIAVVLILGAFVGCTGNAEKKNEAEGEVYNLAMSLGGTSGTFYVMGAGMAEYVNKNSDKLYITPVASGGGVENMRNVNNGSFDIGAGYTGNPYDAYTGQGAHEDDGELKNLRTLGPQQKLNGVHYVVYKDSDIENLSDFVGRRISPGASGSSASYYAALPLHHLGIYDDADVKYYAWDDIPTMMRDREIEAASRFGAVPIPMFQQIAATKDVRVLDIEGQLRESGFYEKYPYFTPYIVPAGSYNGQDKDATMHGMEAMYVISADLPDDVVYELAKIIYSEDCASYMDSVLPAHDLRNKDPFASILPIPLHPGAQRFWEEQGATIPEPLAK